MKTCMTLSRIIIFQRTMLSIRHSQHSAVHLFVVYSVTVTVTVWLSHSICICSTSLVGLYILVL